MERRRIEEAVFKVLMVASAGAILTVLALIVATVAAKGFPALSLSMLTQTPRGGYYLGKEGGILNAIVGSLLLAGGSTLLALLAGFPVVLFMNAYAGKRSRLAAFTRFSLDVLWGVPSIVYGAFGFSIMIYFRMGASLLAGIIAVALLILPIMCRAMDEVMRRIPQELLDASSALGATRLETALKVMVRQALPGIVTAVLVAFGRGIGDAASVIFTAGFTDSIPHSLFSPAATLPLAIFFQLGTPFPEVQARAYAAALVLTAIILAVSIAARAGGRRFARHIVK